MSPIMSTCVSLLVSGGQALVPQWENGLVPTGFSTVVLKPSQSRSITSALRMALVIPDRGEHEARPNLVGTGEPSLLPDQGAPQWDIIVAEPELNWNT